MKKSFIAAISLGLVFAFSANAQIDDPKAMVKATKNVAVKGAKVTKKATVKSAKVTKKYTVKGAKTTKRVSIKAAKGTKRLVKKVF